MTTGEIRLVILDMGATLWEEVPDARAVFRPEGDGGGDEFYRIDADHMYRYEGVSNRIFPGVRELFRELHRRNICVSINSLNTPVAWRWIEAEFFDLNRDGFVRHSRIGEHPDPQKRKDPAGTSIKGIWTREIIDDWNSHELRDRPIENHEVLFVDDDRANHRAVSEVCPGVRCVFPPLAGETGMLDLVKVIDELSVGGLE